MKRISQYNINTKGYWNGVYGDKQKRAEYEVQTDEFGVAGNTCVVPTHRFAKTLSFIKNGDKVLDIGCGVGVLTTMVKRDYPGCDVWGVDISSVAIEDNIKKNPDITYKQGCIGRLKDIPENYFDVVFSGETLEHLDDPNDLLKEAYKALKPGGIFIVTTPNGTAVHSTEHTFIFDSDDVEKLMIDNGFKEPKNVYLPDLEHLMVIYMIGVK